jgi:hypothetical protein
MANQPKKLKPRGRPIRPGDRQDSIIVLRVSREQKAGLVKKAHSLGKTLKKYLLDE